MDADRGHHYHPARKIKMKKITNKQTKILKESIDKMLKSEEQFLFMIFKNPNGTDNVTEYAYNMIPEKLTHYWQKALENVKFREDR